MLLNLTHVSYVDSTGIGEIVGAYTRVVREGGSLKLFGLSARIQELLDTTNIGTVIASFPDEAGGAEVPLERERPDPSMISFIVPAYNEELLIGRTLAAIHAAAREVGRAVRSHRRR